MINEKRLGQKKVLWSLEIPIFREIISDNVSQETYLAIALMVWYNFQKY